MMKINDKIEKYIQISQSISTVIRWTLDKAHQEWKREIISLDSPSW